MPAKKKRKLPAPRDLRAEYDFSNGVRGKYVPRLGSGAVRVVLAPDVAVAFPTAIAVNRALRGLLATGTTRQKRRGA